MALNTHIICRLGHAFPKSTPSIGRRKDVYYNVGGRSNVSLSLLAVFVVAPEDANEDATADQDGTAGWL